MIVIYAGDLYLDACEDDAILGIPDGVKKEVYKRDNNRCQISGRTDNLSIHHILKKSDGGPNSAHNLILVNRQVHDWLHFAHIPSEVYIKENFYLLSRMNALRDFMLIKSPPSNFETAYAYARAMFDAIDKNDPNPPNKTFDITDWKCGWAETTWSNPYSYYNTTIYTSGYTTSSSDIVSKY